MDKGDKKRKKAFYAVGAQKKFKYGQKELEAGMKGFLVTCNQREREVRDEMMSLLNAFDAPKQSQAGTEANAVNDFEDGLAAELQELRQQRHGAKFEAVNTGTKNCIFINTPNSDPNQIVSDVFEDVLKTKRTRSRYILRLLPVVGTCKAELDKIRKLLSTLLIPFFNNHETFAINFKVRNNNSLSRNVMLSMVGDVVSEISPLSRVDLSNPHFMISLDVLKTICCVGVLTTYYQYRKYNIQELVSPTAQSTCTRSAENGEQEDKQHTQDLPLNTGICAKLADPDLPSNTLTSFTESDAKVTESDNTVTGTKQTEAV